MSKIKNQELEIIKNRVNNVGYELLTYTNLFEILKEDTDYLNKAIEVFVFETREEYRIIESHITVRDFESVDELEEEILKNIKKCKSYKRAVSWGKKLYEYAKLNNFAFTFVLAVDE